MWDGEENVCSRCTKGFVIPPGLDPPESGLCCVCLESSHAELLGALGEVLDCLESDERDFDTFVRIGDIAARAINRATEEKQ